MNYIARNNDILSGNIDLEEIHTFNKFPVFMGCTERNSSDDIFADMCWKISKGSGLIQLDPLLPLDVVYKNEHGSGTTGRGWDEHHMAFANFINKFNPKNVLEIGGLHGILAKKYFELDREIKWTIVEPNPIVDDEIPANVIRGFFDSNFHSESKFDTIVHSHVFEHAYDPAEFIKNQSLFMEDGDMLIFSIPNMEMMLKENYINCVNFEHTIYLTHPYIEYFLNVNKFEIIEIQNFKNEHSIFYCARKVKYPIKIKKVNLYDKNKKEFIRYINTHVEDVKKINENTRDLKVPIYLFGAHVFSQYLISFGLDTSKIVCILDNDSRKKGKRLYGTNLISDIPSILSDVPEAVVILRAGTHNEEIKKEILNNINSNIRFI
jgi:2-polyprenyl-3-methyl-5-hydroxy-6-metoxy-1,4-benzoquinol methylase